MSNQDKNKPAEQNKPPEQNTDKKPERDGVAPDTIPEGDAKGPGIQGEQDLSTTATPKAKQTGPSAPKATNPNPPHGKQWYRVKGPGGVKLNGVFLQEGAEVQIAAADAQSIDGYLEVFTPEHL
jgi:hypothetical protein